MLPGSIVKTIALVAALEHGVITPESSRMCRRVAKADGRTFVCSHPDLKRALSPAEALAYSCNDFFASLAPRLPSEALTATRMAARLPPVSNTRPMTSAIVGLALLSAIYFTWRRAGKNKLPLWGHTSKQLVINTAVPFITGGLFILGMLQYSEWRFVVAASLVFYGLALVNGSKYTLSDIRYLGYMEIILGLISTRYIGYGLYFWAFGFGALHIIYGFIMWWKYERNPSNL